ncbi:hypothetical protein [Hymenobacter jejuensis]|uniref:Uncharacterized protein n=1 Tax=Hymenobacter jejuensis TaxID=2502781 RepID=A0A5B8A370_9BACT|nr:hypothetical protein [Hymenobacter jejuensis]QDA61750.1 hypothetical protein FHG12_17340 [Hymenobacter jejuensis]
MAKQLLLTVASSFRLTGLGLLVTPQEDNTQSLSKFDLHTKLEVNLVFPDGHQEAATASIEEMSRQTGADDAPAYYDEHVLLLESDLIREVPIGTEIWWAGQAYDPYALLR